MLRNPFNSFLFLSILIISTTVFAEEKKSDLLRGDKYVSVRGKIQECFVCHGETGASTQSSYPILAGQHLYYIYLQLRDFKSGLRASDIMGPMAAPLKKEEMMLIAEYFSQQTWPNTGYVATPDQITAGKKTVAAGECVVCHLGRFEGDSGVPRLAGQYPEYLSKTMIDFKNKVRKNNDAKSSLFATYSDEELKAAAEYLGGLKSE